MAEPLALLVYEKVIPGTQLVNRLQDRGYRVRSVSKLAGLAGQAAQDKPFLMILDVGTNTEPAAAAIGELKGNAATAHIPVIALVPAQTSAVENTLRQAGAKLVVPESAILVHLDQLLDQALEVD
jgi:DNA-binding NarL/FixJ family response regulator